MKLRTNGLILRPWELNDAPALVAACNDSEIAQWLPMIPSPYTGEDAHSYLEMSRENWERGEAYNFAILDAGTDAVAGSITVRLLRFRIGHFGYWVAAEARARGIATEALKALCRWGVDTLELKRMELLTDPQNIASQRVAEKAGFRREGILRSSLEYRDGARRDSVIFSLLPEELSG